MSRFASRPLPTREDAQAFAREMVPQAKWESIRIAEGSTDDEGDGILLRDCRDCWIVSYDPAAPPETGDERIWLDKATGVVVKMALDD